MGTRANKCEGKGVGVDRGWVESEDAERRGCWFPTDRVLVGPGTTPIKFSTCQKPKCSDWLV